MIGKVDTTALKFNQVSLVSLTLLGFLFNQPWLVLFVGLVLAVGTIFPAAALFKQIYLKLLKPNNILRPNLVDDDPAPHQFAQGVGGAFLLGSSAALFTLPGSILGWALAWLVIILAVVNLAFRFCAGCFVYYQLARWGMLPHPKGE